MVNNRLTCALLLLISLTGLSPDLKSQEFINTRRISLTRGDTIVVAGILADVKIERINPEVYYFWYSNGSMFSNQGGYAGNLLHGEYVEYGKQGNLLLKGSYERGLRSGSWIRWYEEGSTKEVVQYEAGLLEGQSTRYAKDGKICFNAAYKAGILHGDMIAVEKDTVFQISYRKGVEKKREARHVFEFPK